MIYPALDVALSGPMTDVVTTDRSISLHSGGTEQLAVM